MLPAANRLTGSRAFSTVVRSGRRSGRRHLVVHLLEAGAASGGAPDAAGDPTVGFVVSRAVGNAVVRTRVKRRLRHVVRERLADLPAGSVTVVRALPPAADAPSAALAADLDRALARCLASPAPAGVGS